MRRGSCIAMLLGCLIVQPGIAPMAGAEGPRRVTSPAAGDPQVRIANGLVSVTAQGVLHSVLLQEFSRRSGVRIRFTPGNEERISIEFKDVSIEEGLRRILRGRNLAAFYTWKPNPAGAFLLLTLTEVRVLEPAASTPGGSGVLASTGRDEIIGSSRATPSLAAPAGQKGAAADPGPDDRFDGIQSLARALLEVENPAERSAAAERLGKSWSEKAIDPLSTALLQDSDAAVREAAAQALGATWSENAVAPLLTALAEDADALVREQAARALGKTAGEEAVSALAVALRQDPRWYVRDAAARALGSIGGLYAHQVLALAAANDPDGWVRGTAVTYAVHSPR